MKRLLVMLLSMSVLLMIAACGETEPTIVQEEDHEEPVVAHGGPEAGYTEAVAGGPAILSPEEIDEMWAATIDPETVQLIVNGEVLDAPTPYTYSDGTGGTVMIPLVAVAEALGYTVVDNGEEVVVGPGSLVTAGVNSYHRGREAPIELSFAPVIQDGVMFVPWEFFQEILLTSVAYMEGGNVYVVTIDN